MIDMEKEMPKAYNTLKPFNYMMGKQTHLDIFKFRYPIKKKKYNNTLYYFFKARIIMLDGKNLQYGKHTIQLPSKTVCYQIWCMLKEKNRLNDDVIRLTIIKKDNYNYDITLHK